MGYAGGSKLDPSYHDLGDHTEVLRIVYDPQRISYEELLAVFWAGHNPRTPIWSQQYASLILVHDQEQRELAEKSLMAMQEASEGRIHTQIVSADPFYLAEDYHQKYYLRQAPELATRYTGLYPDIERFVASTAATRINGYVGGYGELAQLDRELEQLGLSSEQQARLREIVAAYDDSRE